TKMHMQIAALNIRGNGGISISNPRNKWVHLNQEMRDHHIAMLIVGEAHLNEERKEGVLSMFGKLLHIKHSKLQDNPNAKGVAIVLNKRLTNCETVKCWEIVPGQALQIQIEWHHGKALTILGIYAPNENGAMNARFWKKIKDFYDRNPQVPCPDVMGGDTNIVEDPIDRLPTRADVEEAVLALDELKTALKLYDGWRQTNPNECDYTYQHSNLKLARLDRIYVTHNILESSREWKIEDPAIKTDHCLVSVQITCDEAPETGQGRWSIPQAVLADKIFMTYVTSELKKTAKEMMRITTGQETRTDEHNAQTLFETYKQQIIEKARKCRREIIPRINRDIETLEKEQKSIVSDTSRDDENKMRESGIIMERIQELNRKHHDKKRKNIRLLHKLEGETMSKTWTANGTQRKPRDQIHALQTSCTTANGDIIYEKDSKNMAELMGRFYRKLQRDGLDKSQEGRASWAQAVANSLEGITKSATEELNNELEAIIQADEAEEVIRTAEKGKAAGINGLTYEFWKALL
ncbi:Endonuclease/exonuclease/phosphatase, partial [Armillaria luteobubalina]